MNEHLDLQNFFQTLSVYESEVGLSSAWVCKITKKDRKTSLAKCESKRILGMS